MSSKFRPICVACRREMRCRKNGVWVQMVGAIWAGDRYQCEGCQAQIVTGFGRDPVAYDCDDDFAAHAARSELEVEHH